MPDRPAPATPSRTMSEELDQLLKRLAQLPPSPPPRFNYVNPAFLSATSNTPPITGWYRAI
jgi:hypothetical protein